MRNDFVIDRPSGADQCSQANAAIQRSLEPNWHSLHSRRLRDRGDRAVKRLLDLSGAVSLLVLAAPIFLIVPLAIKLDSPGPVFYRCSRVGYRGRRFAMLKFRKMRNDASGPPLTMDGDDRFTRVGRVLAVSKLDELPQLWNVLKGDMSLVGPRPEDPTFVDLQREAYCGILVVRPGITGLSQLAFAEESRVLDPNDRMRHYLERLFPQKTAMDQLYASRRSLWMDFRILAWTAVAVLLRRDVAVHRHSGELNLRRRSSEASAPEEAAASLVARGSTRL